MSDKKRKLIWSIVPTVLVFSVFWAGVYFFYAKNEHEFMLPKEAIERTKVKIAVTAGPHAIIMDKVKKLAYIEGVLLEVIEFNDFVTPNRALADGDVDVNCMQHVPYLQEQIKARGYDFKVLGKSVLMPMGVYSSKHKNIADIPDGVQISIPNDPTNGGRALLLLAKLGLIKLKNGVENPSVLDIVENSKKLRIVEIEAPQLPRSLDDVAAAVINTDWVVLAEMDPDSAIAMEGKDSPYVNVFVVKSGNETDEKLQTLLRVYQSYEVKEFIKDKFKGAIVAGW